MLLLLGLSRGRTAALASAGLRTGRAGSSPGGFGKGRFRPSSPLCLLSHRGGKGYADPMVLGLFNHLPHHYLCAARRWCGIRDEQGGKPTLGGISRAGKEGGKSHSLGWLRSLLRVQEISLGLPEGLRRDFRDS